MEERKEFHWKIAEQVCREAVKRTIRLSQVSALVIHSERSSCYWTREEAETKQKVCTHRHPAHFFWDLIAKSG